MLNVFKQTNQSFRILTNNYKFKTYKTLIIFLNVPRRGGHELFLWHPMSNKV